MKNSVAFENAIKKYLDEFAQNDVHFAQKYENPKKSISECCSFIASEVKKMGVCGLEDSEVYGLAVHYYDEEDVKVEPVGDYMVACNHHVELTEEQKEEARAEAIKQYQETLYKEMVAKNIKHQTPKKETSDSDQKPKQLTLF